MTMPILIRNIAILLFSSFVLYGCAVNPVTGKQEISFVSENQEISIGEKNYGPSKQMQGGNYTVNPELSLYVSEIGQRLAAVSDRRLPYEFTVLDNSTPNAWALPGGKIAVNLGLLLELENEAELAAVLGHEIVHAAARHGAQQMERGLLLQGAIIATGVAIQGNEYGNLVVGGAQVAAGLISTKYGRDDELEADYYGMLYMAREGYDPMAAVKLQETFVRLTEKQSANWLAGLFASHPPSIERVEANRATAASLPRGGTLGKERFEEHVAALKKDKDGYANYRKGMAALAKGEETAALEFAQKAIQIEPREGHFYALRGDIYFKEGRYDQALSDYSRAIDLNRNYFYYYLQRGLTKKKLNRNQDAYADLQASTKLLPTAIAYNSLGELELAAGSPQKARQYFLEASGSDSPAGREAKLSLLHLDFPEKAESYIQVQVGLNQSGYVFARIINRAPLAIKSIRLAIEYQDPSGKTALASRFLPNVIPAGEAIVANLDLGQFRDATILNNIRVKITDAKLVEQ